MFLFIEMESKVKLSPLGRPVNLGDFYDYSRDKIISNGNET